MNVKNKKKKNHKWIDLRGQCRRVREPPISCVERNKKEVRWKSERENSKILKKKKKHRLEGKQFIVISNALPSLSVLVCWRATVNVIHNKKKRATLFLSLFFFLFPQKRATVRELKKCETHRFESRQKKKKQPVTFSLLSSLFPT